MYLIYQLSTLSIQSMDASIIMISGIGYQLINKILTIQKKNITMPAGSQFPKQISYLKKIPPI